MARKARHMDAYGVYHISQNSSLERDLFLDDEDREKFMTIVLQAKQRFKFKLFAYCLKDPKRYHLVLHANGSDLSKVMKSINIAYAMYAKKKNDGKLFKDRYKSEKIETESDFQMILESLKDPNNCFNSFCHFGVYGQEIDVVEIDETLDDTMCRQFNEVDMECIDCMKTPEEALGRLEEIAKSQGISLDKLLQDKEKRDALILTFRQTSTLSLKALGDVFGGLSESMICKILKDKCQ